MFGENNDYKRQKGGGMTRSEFDEYLNSLEDVIKWYQDNYGHFDKTPYAFGYHSILGHIEEIKDTLYNHLLGSGIWRADIDDIQVREPVINNKPTVVVALIDRKPARKQLNKDFGFAAGLAYSSAQIGTVDLEKKTIAPIYKMARDKRFTNFYIRKYPEQQIRKLTESRYRVFMRALKRDSI